MMRRPPRSTLSPYTPLFRSLAFAARRRRVLATWDRFHLAFPFTSGVFVWGEPISVPPEADEAALDRYRHLVEDGLNAIGAEDRKSTRLNSSHLVISYAVFCL